MRILTSIAVLAAVAIASIQVAHADRYIILYKKHSLPAELDSTVDAIGGQVVARIDQVGIAIAESDNPNFATQMGSDVKVKSVGVEPVWSLPEHTATMAGPEALPEVSQPDAVATAAFFQQGLLWGIQRVRAPEAWAADVTGSHATTVAVIDTGIAWNHPDLAPNVTFVACMTSAGSWFGPWAAGAPCNPYPTLSTHGTHVAGTVAATLGFGVVGVGPNLALAGYNTFEVIPGCGVCSFTSSRWIAELDAAARGFQVINMSLGSLARRGGGQGSGGLATFIAADNRIANLVINAGTTIVSSAGNAGVDLNGTLIAIPADLPGVVSVAATGIQPVPRYIPGTSFDIRAFYSNHGASIGLAAPGGDCGLVDSCNPATRPTNWFEHLVLSTTVSPNAACAQTASCPLGWGWIGGTSMASPHVAGVVGLIRDQNPQLNARQAANAVKRTAEELGDNHAFGAGMVDARGAIDD